MFIVQYVFPCLLHFHVCLVSANVFLVVCKGLFFVKHSLHQIVCLLCVHGKSLGIHPLLDAPFQLSTFIVASVKGVSGDSSMDKCLLSHWASSYFPLPSLKDILLNTNTYFSSHYKVYHCSLFIVIH